MRLPLLSKTRSKRRKARKASYKKHERKKQLSLLLQIIRNRCLWPPERSAENEPCPCGSGKKYKKCCLKRDEENAFVTLTGTRSDDDIISADTVFDYGKPCIDDAFLRTNDVHEISGLRLLYSLILNPIVEELAHKTVLGFLNRGREEMDLITNATGVEALLAIMRNNPDADKPCATYEETRELQGTGCAKNSSGTEKATKWFICRAFSQDTTQDREKIIQRNLLILLQQRNRNAYAISVLCVSARFYDNDESEKLMWDYYHYMKRTIQ